MARPKILVLDHTAKEGGAELALLRLAEMLHTQNTADLRVILFADGPLRGRLSAAGVATAVLPLDARVGDASRDRIVTTAARSATTAAAFVPRLARAIRGSGADLVVANSLKAAVFAFIAAPLAGRPWVWHLHDRLSADYLPIPLLALMRMIAVLGPRSIVANSRATLSTLPARAQRKASVAYPGLPASAFTEQEQHHPGFLVGIVGRISPTKGQREFLEAAAIVARSLPSARFVVVGGALFGEDVYEGELRELAERLGVSERVEFTGWVSDVARRVRDLSVLVHASPVPEPFGQVIIEAMAEGVPVIATSAGGAVEILDPELHENPRGLTTTDFGILVPPGDYSAIAHAVRLIADAPEDAILRAVAARASALSRFSIQETALRVSTAWNGALPARRRSGPVA